MRTDFDISLFLQMLSIDSTSGQEESLIKFLSQEIASRSQCKIEIFESQEHNGKANILCSWGNPQIVYCTHLDTVPPYIPPTFDQMHILGRGTCDAKGQIISMLSACLRLEKAGETGFGLLLLHGEETGSYGAKEYASFPGGKCVIVGEPTDNKMASASKGTKTFDITIHGRSCHSGYPELGISAVNLFLDLMQEIAFMDFPIDPILGKTTWNVGKLVSDNPQNILSPLLTCRIYFRTTFASDEFVVSNILGLNREEVSIKCLGGDTPMHYLTLPGFETTTVAFGSDAPQLSNFKHKALCGPGSIMVAHTSKEKVAIADIEKAIDNYVNMFSQIKTLNL